MGFSIKQYIQIIRIQHTINVLQNKEGPFNVSSFGYYDQSHFIKEFKKYTLLLPSTIQNDTWRFV